MVALVESTPLKIIISPRERAVRRLKFSIWLYFFLLIIEGAVRKWIPPLSVPFLVVRDPLAFFIWFSGAHLKIGDRRAWTYFYVFAWVITSLGLLQIIGTSVSSLIILYGWRSYVLHIPVIIVLAGILDAEDLRKIGKWLLLLSIPMTVLMVMEYLAPADSFLNRGTSDAGGQITGALGHIRPAGTFSFITGPISFYPLVAVVCLWGFARKELFPRWLLLSSAIATVVVIPVSISRTIAITIAALLVTALGGAAVRGGITFRPQRLPQIAIATIFIICILFGVFQVPLVQDATNTFLTRWTEAQGGTGNNSALEARSVSLFTEALDPLTRVSVLGTGIGSGSAVAASLRGRQNFEYGENPLQQEVFELGSWLGPLFVLARFAFAFYLAFICFKELYRGSILPWLLVLPAALGITQGSLDQTTSQGFIVVTIGISIAAIRASRKAGL